MDTQKTSPSPGESAADTGSATEASLSLIHMLLVEDNQDDVFLTKRAFSALAPDVAIDAVSRGQDAILRAARGGYDIAVVDYKLPDMDGMEVMSRIAAGGGTSPIPVILVTGGGDHRVAVQALRGGAEDYVIKEEGYLRHLPHAVLGAVKRSRLDRENRRLIAETSRQAGLLEAVLKTDPGAIAVLRGPQMRIEVVNPSFLALSPVFQNVDPVGRPLDELFPALPEQAVPLRKELQKAFDTGQPAHLYDTEIFLSADARRYYHIHMLPLNPGSPREERDIAIILWDTTREVEARQQVEEYARRADAERAWLQTVIDQMPLGVHIAEAPSARTILANQAADEIMGRVLPENLSSPDISQALGIVDSEGKPIPVEELPLQRAIWREQSVSGQELRLKRTDGSEIDMLVNAAPLYDSGGQLMAGVAVFQDITRIKEAERLKEEIAEQAEAQRAWLQAVIDQMPSGIYIVSAPEGRILFTNRAADALFGPPPVSYITDPDFIDFYRTSNLDGTKIRPEDGGLAKALRTGQPVTGRQTRHQRDDGTFVDILSNAAPLFDTKGQIVAAVSVFQDITQLKEVEHIKDEFVSIASHELRTPLTSLKAAGQLLMRRARQHDYAARDTALINTIIQQADRMTRLIEELLDVSRIQSGRLQLQVGIFDLSSLAREVLDASAMGHPDYNHVLNAPEPVWIDADRDRIAQVVINLVDNAVKYNSPGGMVEVSVAALHGEREAELRVRDNGMGFLPEQSEEVFERFARLGTVANHSRGMGLGLFICRQIMDSHGGTITAHSDGPGEGATFTVRLPLVTGSRSAMPIKP